MKGSCKTSNNVTKAFCNKECYKGLLQYFKKQYEDLLHCFKGLFIRSLAVIKIKIIKINKYYIGFLYYFKNAIKISSNSSKNVMKASCNTSESVMITSCKTQKNATKISCNTSKNVTRTPCKNSKCYEDLL